MSSALNSDKVKAMFQHGYDSYMRYAYPRDELSPLSCTGRDTWGRSVRRRVDHTDREAERRTPSRADTVNPLPPTPCSRVLTLALYLS